MVSKKQCRTRLLVFLLALFLSQGCGSSSTGVPTPAATIPPDFITNVQTIVSAIEAKKPGVFHSLIGEDGVAVGGFAQGLSFKGYDNSDEIVEAFADALDQSAPVCTGFVSYVGDLPDRAIVVYQGINFDWERFGIGGNNSDSMSLQLFKLPEGWRLVYMTPFNLATDLSNLGPLQPCPEPSSLMTSSTPQPVSTLTLPLAPTLTPVPRGIFVVFFYEPLVMEYDPSMWEDTSNYRDWGLNRDPATGTLIENSLQVKNLKSCNIGVQGLTGFQQVTPEKVQLGDVEYQVITFLENKSVGAFYIEDHSLSEYNYEHGLPIAGIQANSAEWSECNALAEEVLATLHVP